MFRRSDSRAALTVLFACLVCQMGLGLGGYVYATFLKQVVAEMGWTRTAFSFAGLPFLLALSLASPVAGTLTERFGPRRVFSTAITLVAIALTLFSFMQSLAQFYLIGLLLGAAVTGLGDIPAGATVSKWFTRRRGLALGLVYIGSNIGGSLVPIVATEIAAGSSWRVALRVLAAGGFLLIFPVAMWLVRDPPAGYGEGEAEEPETGADGADLTLSQAMRTRSFWILWGVLFTFYFYYVGINRHLVSYLADSGFSDAAAARHLSATIAVGIFGKIGIGLLADRLPMQRTIVINFALMTGASILLLFVGGQPGLLPAFLVIQGVTVAAENVVLPLIIVHCFGVAHMARIYGAIMTALLPGGALGPVFAAYMFDTMGTYQPAFVTFAVLNVGSVIALLFLRRR